MFIKRRAIPAVFRLLQVLSFACQILAFPSGAQTNYRVVFLEASDHYDVAGQAIGSGYILGSGTPSNSAGPTLSLMWTGVFSNPITFTTNNSSASLDHYYRIEGDNILGIGSVGYPSPTSVVHALLRNRLTGAVVDLHPPGYRETWIRDLSYGRQLGYGYLATNGERRFLLWAGTPESSVILQPPKR